MRARLERQIVATAPARMGLLAEVCASLERTGVDLTAISAYERDGVAKFLLVTEDIVAATTALEDAGASVSERTAVALELPDEPGALGQAARRIADAGINVFYVYATSDTSAERATVIVKTADDETAAALF